MKRSTKEIHARRQQIKQLVAAHSISLTELSKQLNISEMTARRDCAVLEKMGIISRHKGILSILNPTSNEHNLSINSIEDILAAEAAKYVKDNTVLFINSSKTAIKTVNYLTAQNVTVVTNNLNVLHEKLPTSTNLILSGGRYYPSTKMMAGDLAFNSFNGFHADYAIIGCDGITPNDGVTTSKIEGARINRVIVNHSKKVILVTSYAKIGNVSNLKIADPEDIDIMITDTFVDKQQITQLQNKGIQVSQLCV
ncbi:DeoR/GlpR family DNA-binding transcription regulator [Ligilactobacillus sp. LYQ60]|uniref:DeoR/GlpR family DNA-binding transcription regulator n=1 Tax=Ligilactobacillus sp. LYQ60 TaxID=3378799 RepID=UPI003853D880